jgi:hypothetical protein
MHTNGSDEEGDQFDPEGAARLSRADSYYTTTSAGLARARSIAGESSYSTIAYNVCSDTEVSTEPRSVRSVSPTHHRLPIIVCLNCLPCRSLCRRYQLFEERSLSMIP